MTQPTFTPAEILLMAAGIQQLIENSKGQGTGHLVPKLYGSLLPKLMESAKSLTKEEKVEGVQEICKTDPLTGMIWDLMQNPRIKNAFKDMMNRYHSNKEQ